MKIFSTILPVLFILLLAGCKESEYSLSRIVGGQIAVTDSIAMDAEIENFIKPYRESVEGNLSEVLAHNTKDMVKTDGDLNTAIGNMMADIVILEAQPVFQSRTGKSIDFVLLNYGGIRAALPKGDVTQRTAYNIMPFENEIVVLELSYKSVEKILEYLQLAKIAHPVSGLEIILDDNYQLTDLKIQGETPEPEKTYYVATSDYLMDGGDNMTFFSEALSVTRLDYKIRNALIDHFKKTDTLDYQIDNRFIRIQP